MRSIVLLGFAALMLLPSSAWAQSDEAKAQAVQRYEEGNVLHNAGKEEDAYVRFAQAYELYAGEREGVGGGGGGESGSADDELVRRRGTGWGLYNGSWRRSGRRMHLLGCRG